MKIPPPARIVAFGLLSLSVSACCCPPKTPPPGEPCPVPPVYRVDSRKQQVPMQYEMMIPCSGFTLMDDDPDPDPNGVIQSATITLTMFMPGGDLVEMGNPVSFVRPNDQGRVWTAPIGAGSQVLKAKVCITYVNGATRCSQHFSHPNEIGNLDYIEHMTIRHKSMQSDMSSEVVVILDYGIAGPPPPTPPLTEVTLFAHLR